MSLFEKIFGSKKEKNLQVDSFFKTLSAYTPSFTSWSGGIYESELVRSAIHVKAEYASKMSVRFYGSAERSLQSKLRIAPNEFQTWSQFLYRLSTILDVTNNCFIIPVINEFGVTTGIYVALPSQCDFVQKDSVPYIRYRFGTGDIAVVELDRCGIMTKHQFKDDFVGDSNVALNNTMSLIDIQSQAIEEGVRSSATFRFMAQMSNFVKPEDLAKEKKRFTRENMEGEGGFLLFPNTYTNIKQIESKPFVQDAEQMKLINTNVYNYFGVNENIMQGKATPEEIDAFINGTVEPLAIQLSEVLSKMLFTTRERQNGNEVIVESEKLMYMSVKDKVSLIQTLGDRGMLTINEARELLNYAPVSGGDSMMPMRGEYANAIGEKEEKEVNDDEQRSESV